MTSKRVIAFLTAVMLALAGVFTSGATPAQAAVYNALIGHNQTGDCIDASISQGVQLKTCYRGNDYQMFDFGDTGTVWTRVQSQQGFCLDGSISSGVRPNTCSAPGTNPYQVWGYNSTTREIRHYQSAYCLDGAASTGVRLRPCSANHDNAYQKWSIFR